MDVSGSTAGDEPTTDSTGTIGIALSGGGHRATAWAFGALLYLSDAGQQHRVVSIASVSGGSIANGVVARRVDYAKENSQALRAAIAPALRHIAHDGLFFFGPATNAYVYAVLGLAGLSLAALTATLVVSVTSTGWVVVGAALATIALFIVSVGLFSRRSVVADGALDKVHFGGAKLTDLTRTAEHIFCVTELQAGNHIYFASRFIYGYRHGIGVPGPLALSTAVQCSACLPGAFAPRRLPAGRHQFNRIPGVKEPAKPPLHLIVNDGGVYDNMGDEWFAGYADRVEAWPDLPLVSPAADELVVVNASAGWGWQEIKKWWVPGRELVGVLRSKDVLYNSSTRIRRRDLIETFRAHELAGDGYVGALVHIAQSPFVTADGFAAGDDERGRRARAVIALLGDTTESRQAWKKTAEDNAKVKTVLRKLGADDTVRLLYHAYVLAMCNLHVLLDYPLLPLPGEVDLRSLVADG